MLLKDLQYAMDIIATKSLSKSAERLFITQPALTQSVRRLEEYFEVKLFNRTRFGMEPTREGILFAEYAVDILSQCDRFKERLKEAQPGRKAYLKVGTAKVYGKHFMPLYIKPFGDKHPDINIEFIEDRSTSLEMMLLNGMLDVCIMAAPIESNLLSCTPLFYEELLVALPTDHPLNIPNYPLEGETLPEINLAELAGETFIISKEGYKLNKLCLNMCRMLGFWPKQTIEIESVDTIISFVRNNRGIGFVPDTFAKRAMWECSANYYRIKNANSKRAFMITHLGGRKLSYVVEEFISTTFDIQEKIQNEG